MGLEIERKYLVQGQQWKESEGELFQQSYLTTTEDQSIRVRITPTGCFLTIKGKRTNATRQEFEYSIPTTDAQELMRQCSGFPIRKYRYTIAHANLAWTVDEFLDENQGLVIAEIELDREDQVFQKPRWAKTEVTDDPRYYNSYLSKHPFNMW